MKPFFFKKLQDDYLKNILTMMGGVFLSQVIMVIGSFFLTRIFTPEDLGLIALFLSLTSILSVIATGRFEHSIILPKSNLDGYKLMFYTSILVTIFSLLLFLVIYPFNNTISQYLNNPDIRSWLFYLPIMVVLNSLFFAFRAWLIRRKEFKIITFASVIKAVVLNSILIVGGIIYGNVVIFLIANIIAQFVETILLFLKLKDGQIDFEVKKKEAIGLFRKYDKFPKYLLPGDLVNTYASQNPIILLNLFFGNAVVGYYSLAQRVLGLPIKLISNTTKEVYKQKATEEFNKNGNCKEVFVETFKMLFLTSLVPAVILYILAPWMFSFFFGDQWEISGYYSRYLLFMFCLQFSVSPLSYTLFIRGWQKYDLYWQISLLLVTSIGIYMGFLFNSAHYSILGFSLAYAFMYLVYLKLIYNAAK